MLEQLPTVSIMEKQPVVFGNEDGGSASGTAPAFYVLVKQPQTSGKSDQEKQVSNQDDTGLASGSTTPVKSKGKTCLPADCISGDITVTLDNNSMWNEFYHRSTEMILTKQGRRMFPYCRYWITGLESSLKYILIMDISPVDNFRYKWNGHSWEPSGKAEPHVLGRVFMHPESPSSGNYWMHQPVSFYKLKLTNNTLDQEGHIILHSMHRYLPRLHLVPADKAIEVIQLNGPDVHTFTFPQTEFFAVTAYQNIQITQLKIDYNPFAKGFRDDGLSSKPHRDAKQNGSSEQEGGSVTSSPSNHRHPTEGDILEQRSLEPSLCRMGNTDLEKELLSPDHDFLGIMDTDMHVCDSPVLKQEESESPVASPCQSNSHVASPLNSNGSINVVVKEEPADDYDYGPSVCMKEICVKQEESDKETEEYSNSDDSIPEKELKKRSEMGRKEMEIDSRKRPRSSQLGVAKAKMLKLDSGKMPVVYLEPCAVTRNTVKVSALSQTMLSLSKNDKSHLGHSGDSLPQCFESDSISSPFTVIEVEQIPVEKQVSGSNVPHTCPSFRDGLWENTEMCSSLTVAKKASSYSLKPTTYSDLLSGKDICEGGKTSAPKTHMFRKSIVGNQKVVLPGPRKRGRPRKIKQSEVGQPSKYTGKSIATSSYASLGPGTTHLDVKPDLEDVDGVLFVSFASKEALDIHTVDRSEEKEELPNMQTPLLAACDSSIDSDDQRIQQLEKDLLEDLKSFKYKQVIHPSLQEVGLKLNLVDPTMSIDLKYLGVQLPLSYSNDYILWKTLGTNSSSVDTGLPFVSRTGKTNDFTKIKGWRGKLHSSSKNESSILEGSLKNRSAFCSDKLDEYLENEGKLMETSMEFSPSTSSCPVVYQLPTKSTSYVRTLDSVLKKQSTVTPSDSYIFKPLSVPSVSKKKRKNIKKIKNKKQAAPRGKGKLPHKSVTSLPVVTKQKRHLPVLEEKVAKSQPSSQTASEADAPVVAGVEENVLGKPIPVRQAQQQQQSSRLPSLSKTQLKLMDLEDCVLWDGKPRTYITEERADLSLTTLLTAQASLKNKPIHKIVKRRAPPCNNDFCRLGCVCSSLALEKRQPTHCRKPDCMFGCTCLKRRVVLVKGGFKHKKILEKPVHERHKLYSRKQPEQEEAIEKEQEKLKLKDRKRRKKVEYTICDTEPETPVKNFPLWIKVDGEMDPEPVYIPTPSAAEPTKPMMQPISEVLPSDNKPSSGGVKPSSSGAKPGRVYTPRPNPVIREEDKDPVYLYFESMMTCARVRMYERKKQEKKQQQKCPLNSERNIEKEHNPEPQPSKMEEDKESGSGQKSWWFSCSAEDPSTSYVHHTTPGGTTKLIEIVSDCNWEEDRNEILNILSQHVKTKMPKSLKVGNFVIDLESESKTWDERNTPIYSSRVKISVPSCQSKGEKARISVSESPDDRPSPCKRTEKITFLTPGMLREQRKKGLPFYAGLSPAGKLTAYTCQSDLNPLRLIQVNGKNYPQAKLLLGQMGALHPANRLAAYITGRLRPSVLDLSTLSTVISKVASGAKLAPFESQSAEVPTSDTSKTSFSSMSTSTATAIGVHAPAQRQIAARPLVDALPSQLVMSVVGALQQKMPVVKTSQPLSGPQNFNIKYSPVAPATTSVATTTYATIAVVSPTVTAASPSGCNKATNSSSDTAVANAIRKLENSTSSATTTAATVTITKPTGTATSVATIAFAKSIVAASPVAVPVSTVSTASLSPVLTTVASTATVTTPTSPTSCVLTGPSGIQTSPLSNQKPGATSPPGLSPGAEKRMGPRLLLIPVRQGSPTLQPAQNIQPSQGQGKRMILQPIRNPGGVNLYRHPNGQIIQLVPLHQFQPAKFQPSLPPVAFRSPGSVVGIQLPGPSKLSDTTVCQSTSVSSATPATMATSVLSGPPSTLLTPTTELPRVMPALRPLLPEAPSALLETRTTEAPSALLEAPTTTELPRVMPALRPLLPEAPSVLLEAPTVKTPSVLLEAPTTTELPRVMPALRPLLPEATSALLEAPTIKTPSVLLEAPTAEAPSVLPEAPIAETPSALPESSTAEASSTLPEAPTNNQTLQAIRSVPAPSISATQAASIIPPVPVLVSQAGILTLRISPSGVKSISNHTDSDSKTICSMNGQPDNTLNMISLQSGSFALLQFPEQKDVSSSTVKPNVSLEVKNTDQKDEFSTVQLEEKASSSQEVEAVESEVTMSDTKPNENILLANQPDSHSEEITDDRNTITSDLPEKGVEQLSTGPPIFQPDTASSDHTYMSEKLKCEEIKMMVKMKQPPKHPKGIPGEVPYTSESVHEECSQIAALTQNTLQEQKRTRQLKSPNEEEAHTVQSPAAESEEAEQMHLEMEEGVMVEPSQKELDKQKVHTNCTEKLQKKTKSSLIENQDLELLEMGTKEEDYSVAAEWDQEEAGEIPKVSSAKEQNSAEEANNVGCTQEVLYKRNTSFQENCDASNHKKSTADNLEENQIAKDSLVQGGRTWNKISRQSVALESKNGMDADEYLEKHTKCIEQNTLKTSHERNDSTLIIDITMDDTEKDEKTDDSADEMVDEVSGYQSEDIVNVETLNDSEYSEVEENVDIETVEELSEKINIARMKATAAHALLSKQLHLVRDHSNKTPKQSDISDKKPKKEEEAFANYRQTHTANERRRRKEMRGLFEKLKATLGLQALPKVSKCFILKQAFEEIQGLTDQADKLTGQKNLLMRKQDTLIRKVSALSGKTQEVVLKKLEYIYAKQKAVEAQKKQQQQQQQQAEPVKVVETAETAKPSLENSSSSLFREIKPVTGSNKRTKPLILSRKGSRVTGETSPVTLTNASLVMTAHGQVLAIKSPLLPGQVATLPSTLLQAELKSDVDSRGGATQPGIASVMIQLPGSTVPVQVKGILPNSTIPITLSAVASSPASPVIEMAPELTSETEDSFMMPRIVNVTSLATEENTNLNLEINKNPYVTSGASSQVSESSLQVVAQETTNLQSEEKADASCGKERDATGTVQDFPREEEMFPQIVNVSSLKDSGDSFATKLCIEELPGSQAEEKQTDRGDDGQKAKNSSFQKLQPKEPKDSGIEMELQKVASAIQEAALDASDLIDIEENDDTDETLTSLLNEIAFLNQQLNDDSSDIAELPNSLSSGFSLGDVENRRESSTADGSPFQFGALGGSFKDLSVVQESSDSITPLLLHLDDDDLPEGNRNSRELSSESDALKIMLGSEVKDSNPDHSAVNSGGSGKNMDPLAKTRSLSPPILQMKANQEGGNTDTTWRPMPKLAPLGLKGANFSLDSEGQNTKVMPLLAPIAAKEITAQPLTSASQDCKAMPALAPIVTRSK